MRALKAAGYANEAGVAQTEANTLAVETSLHDLGYPSADGELALPLLLGDMPHTIAHGGLEKQGLPDDLAIGVPLQMLFDRPDVLRPSSRSCSHTTRRQARFALYPSMTLSGTVGWTNNSGGAQGIVNPGKLFSNAAGSLLQRSQRQRQPRPREDRQGATGGVEPGVPAAVLNAGAEVNNALTQ